MSLHKRLWNWCPRPKKRVSIPFTRLAMPIYVSILIGGLLLTAYTTVALLPPIFIESRKEGELATVVTELERVSFLSGAIIVRRIQQVQYGVLTKGYISVGLEAHIASEKDLSAYVNSRTNALNALLNSASPDSIILAAITFKHPITPEEFMSICKASLLKLGVYAIIITDELTGIKSMEILDNDWLKSVNGLYISLPIPEEHEFIESLRHIKESHRLDGIIGAMSYITVEVARMLQSDPRVLLIDSHEDPITQEIANKYRSMGFNVEVGPASILSQAVKLKHGVAWVSYPLPLPSSKPYEEHASITPLTVDELLGNPLEYDGQVVYVFGMISELGHLEGPFFRLDGKLLVCYSYNKTDLQSQLSGVQNGDPMVVMGIFQYDHMTLYVENIRPSKD